MRTTKRFEAPGHPALVYDDYGDPAAPAVVLLHGGAAGSRHAWLDISRRLARAYRVLAMDMRGHGDSERADGDYRIEHYASDVEVFIERVVQRPAALVGHSLGGLVAAQVAGTRPDLVSKVFFEDPPLLWDEHPPTRRKRTFRSSAFRERVEALLDDGVTGADLMTVSLQEWTETGELYRPRQVVFRALRDRGSTVDEIVEMLLASPTGTERRLAALMSPDALRGAVTGVLAFDPRMFKVGPDWLAAYDSKLPIRCPVHVLRADPAKPPPLGAGFRPEWEESFLATHPQATVELVEGASHGIHYERPEWFADQLMAFLEP